MRRVVKLGMILLCATGPLWAQDKNKSNRPLARLGTDRGICVLMGDTAGERSLALAKDSSFLIYVQLDRADDVRKVRERVDEAGLYGTRIYVEHGDYRRIHLADKLADALVATGDATKVAEQEVLRVLRPQARALIGKRTLLSSR